MRDSILKIWLTLMIHSMTGFATQRGQSWGYVWVWQMRAVNGKGLDLRLRLPDWIEGLEPLVRGALSKALGRGNVSLELRVDTEGGAETARVDPEGLARTLAALQAVELAAEDTGATLSAASTVEVLKLPGVLAQGAEVVDTTDLRAALMADLPDLIAAFQEMRAREGGALHKVLTDQLDQIAQLVDQAIALAPERQNKARQVINDALARISDVDVDADRVAQELALIAVKADVTEELDRLTTHIAAAREMLDGQGPVGRKLDFLMQEFNREANTLCSKSQYAPLTTIGLDLKATIDQMREQVQNVE